MADIDQALALRMADLIRRMASIEPLQACLPVFSEARAIFAELPEPVDPDDEEAYRLASEILCGGPSIRLALAAIKRGRELQKEGR